MAKAEPAQSGSEVPFDAETWPIIEHEPERAPDVPPDLREVDTKRREWIGTVGTAPGQVIVAVQWPEREMWDTCRSWPVVSIKGAVLKVGELRDLRTHLDTAIDLIDAAIAENRLPWEVESR